MKKSILAITVFTVASSMAQALDESAILERLEQLEQQRIADQKKIEKLERELNSLKSGSGALQSSEAKLLEQKIAKVESKAKKYNSSLKKKIESDREKLKINGFMSAYAVKATVDNVSLQRGVDSDWNFRADSVAGLQFDYQLSEDIDAVVQLVAKGNDDFNIEAEWAFLRYELAEDWTVRAGRLRLPLYMYSESIEVGYTYPWVRPSVEVYITDVTTYEGLDVNYSWALAGWDNDIQVYYGSMDYDNLEVNDAAGIAMTFSKGDWTLRGSYHYLDSVVVALDGTPGEGGVEYTSIGVRYDNGSWFALAEAADMTLDEDVPVVGNIGFNGTLGYQFDKWMPYVAYSRAYSDADHEKMKVAQTAPIDFDIDQESFTLGLRYALSSQVALKAEATQYDNFNGTLGVRGLGIEPELSGNIEDVLAREAMRDEIDDGVTVMSLGFDAVF